MEKLRALGDSDEEILASIKEEQIDQEIVETGIFRESIHQMIVKIDETLKFDTQDENSDNSADLNASSNSSMGMEVKAKLPLNYFEEISRESNSVKPLLGRLSNAIDENQQLSDVDKFNYLKNFLEKPAATAIKGLPLTADIMMEQQKKFLRND